MLLTPAVMAPTSYGDRDLDIATDDTVRNLASVVRSTFPELRFSRAVVDERGGDHRMLLLDDTHAVRFPRATTHDLDLEIAVLAALRERCGIAVPHYLLADPEGRFAVYRLIAGDELTPRRFARLPMAVRHHVLGQAGRFLAALHGLIPEEVARPEAWRTLSSAADHVMQARSRSLPTIARAFPMIADAIEAFYERHAHDVAIRRVILHGDLVDDHILLAKDGLRLAGIIDFGDVALGDPAHDLLGFWAYGSDAVAQVIAAYDVDTDDDLQGRSYRTFIRYSIDRFAELLAGGDMGAAERSLPALTALLAARDPSGAVVVTQQVPEDTAYIPRRW